MTAGMSHRLADLIKRTATINLALADQAVVSGASFLTTILIARFLGVETFGQFALAWLGVFFVQNLQIALIAAPMMTIGPKYDADDRPTYAAAAVSQQAALAVVSTGLVYAGATFSAAWVPSWGLAPLAVPLCLLVLAGQIADFLRRFHFTFGRPVLSFIIDCLRYGGQSIGLFVLLALGSGETELSTVLYLMAGTASAGAVVGIGAIGPLAWDRKFITAVVARHWVFSRWLVPSAVATWGRENMIFGAVGATLGLAEVGILRAAQQIVFIVNVPLQGFSNVEPMRSGAAFATKGFTGLMTFVSRFIVPFMAAIAVLLVAIAISGDWLMTTIYGQAYADHGYVVAAFAVIMMIYLVKVVFSAILRAMETTAYEFHAAVASLGIVVLTAYPLVTALGVSGALICHALFECAALLAVAFGLKSRYLREIRA